MKLQTLLLSGLLLASTIATAQTPGSKAESKLYARFGAGYGFTHAGQTTILDEGSAPLPFNGTGSQLTGVSGGASTLKLKPGSFGTGLSLTLAGGYMISRYVGLEFGVNAIVLPTKYKYTETSTGSGISYNNSISVNAKLPVSVVPAIVLTTGNSGVNAYSRIGLVVPVSDKLSIKTDRNQQITGTNATKGSEEYTLSQYFRLGFQAAAGLRFPVAKKVSLWAELNVLSRNSYAKKLEMTAALVDGVNLISTYTTSSKVTEYDFEWTSIGGTGNNSNSPQKALTSSVPYSSLGVSAGLSVEL